MQQYKPQNRLSLRERARLLKKDILALFLALKHPLTPWYAKLFTALVVGYALSPIDFIPDFIPVLGYLDDIILLPIGIAFAIRLIPSDVMDECRAQAATYHGLWPKIWLAAALILIAWVAIVYGVVKVLGWV